MTAVYSNADLGDADRSKPGDLSRNNAVSTNETVSKSNARPKRSRVPMFWALAIAVFGLVAMLIVDHGPWNRPQLQTEEASHGTTGAAASAVGATVTPTAPKPELEPTAPGPKRAQPANPATP
jgi:hypothetical protein